MLTRAAGEPALQHLGIQVRFKRLTNSMLHNSQLCMEQITLIRAVRFLDVFHYVGTPTTRSLSNIRK